MATKSSRKPTRLEAIRAKPPGELTDLDLDLMIAETERKIALITALAESDAWALVVKVRQTRSKHFSRQIEGLVKRLAQPVEGKPPVTTDQLTYLRGQQDENTNWLTFPARASQLWQQEREHLIALRQQRASSLPSPPRR